MNFKPTVVLATVTASVSALLIAAHNLTYTDTSGIVTEKLLEQCISVMGEGDYSVVTDWKAEGYAIDRPDSVEKLIKSSDGRIAFEIVADGYNKEGLDLLIAMNSDGRVDGVGIVSIAETPGLGTNVEDDAFLSEFRGASDNVSIVKKTPKNDTEIEAVTGATYSSKGVASAVNTALSVYSELGVSR